MITEASVLFTVKLEVETTIETLFCPGGRYPELLASWIKAAVQKCFNLLLLQF